MKSGSFSVATLFRFALVRLILLGMFRCKPAHTPMVQHPHLLPGLWESTGNIKLYEEWWLPNDSTLIGRNFSLNGSDTLFTEKMELNYRGGKWTFWIRVHDNDNKEGVPFALQESAGAMVFENANHDYPNRIVYKLVADTLLDTRIENLAGNKSKVFSFRKIGCTR